MISLLISVELKLLASKGDPWEAEDREEMAESMEEVRGMTRWAGRSPVPVMECIEFTEDEADRSDAGAWNDFGVIVSSSFLPLLVDSASTGSGDCDKL